MGPAEFMRVYWPIAAFITPFLLAGGFAWLRLQFPTKADLEKLRTDREQAVMQMRGDIAREIADVSILARTTADRQISSEEKISWLIADAARSPSKLDLSKDIGKVAERVGRIEASVNNMERQFATHNSYLHTLVEKGLDKK